MVRSSRPSTSTRQSRGRNSSRNNPLPSKTAAATWWNDSSIRPRTTVCITRSAGSARPGRRPTVRAPTVRQADQGRRGAARDVGARAGARHHPRRRGHAAQPAAAGALDANSVDIGKAIGGRDCLVGPYFLWKLLIDESCQGRGYGTAPRDRDQARPGRPAGRGTAAGRAAGPT